MSGRYPTEQYAFEQRNGLWPVSHRGYIIKRLLGSEYTISKDGHHICYASSVEAAKGKIDTIA